TVEDANNNPDTNFTGNITLQLAGDPAGNSTLGGTLTEPVQNGVGVADFGDLTLNHAGHGFTLTATASGAQSTTSGPIDWKDQLAIPTQPPSPVTAGKQFDVKVSAEDVNNKVDTDFTGSVDLAFSKDPNGNSTLGGTHPQSAMNGVA